MNEYQQEYTANRTGPWTAGPPDGDAFPALSNIVGVNDTIVFDAGAQSNGAYLPEGSDSTVVAGYIAQHALQVRALQDNTRAAYELLNFNYGAFSNANMRPFSHGIITVCFPLRCACSWSLISAE